MYSDQLTRWVQSGSISQQEADYQAHEIEEQAIFYSVGGLLIALVVGYFFASGLVRPIRVLQQGARRIGDGDLDYRVATDNENELEELAVTINQMAESLQSREQEITQRNRDLSMLYEVAHSMSESRELVELLAIALEKALEITGSRTGCILMDEKGELQPVLCRSHDATEDHQSGSSSKIFNHAAGVATSTGKAAVFDLPDNESSHYDSIACVPMKFEGKLQGAICVTGTRTDFPKATLDLLSALGSEVAVAIENTRLFEKMEGQNLELAMATTEIASLISEAEKNKSFGTRYQNPNLIRCWESKKCAQKACPAYDHESNLRCWQVAGTHCGGEVQGVFAQKLGRCEKCEVFKAACPDRITMMGETFNNMMAVLEQRVEQQEELQRQLYSSSKLAAIGELAAGVAHEINNPLTGILGNTLLIKSHPQDAASFEKRVSVIESETLRARDIVRNLLDFARKGDLERTPAAIDDLIEHTLLLMQHQADLGSVKINTRLDDALPQLIIDANQMKQVFINIIHNAIQSMPDGGVLDITSHLHSNGEGKMMEIAFEDSGVGMDMQAASRVFDPFFTTKRVGEGTGLGLSVSQRIVSEHGGEITVESEPGNGSIFRVILPVKTGFSQEERHVA
ncbi:MAG: ATP-binding protein [Thermoleophilia bacterium]|jgi:signal transduction histidine kinase